jgi:hypothetical protein
MASEPVVSGEVFAASAILGYAADHVVDPRAALLDHIVCGVAAPSRSRQPPDCVANRWPDSGFGGERDRGPPTAEHDEALASLGDSRKGGIEHGVVAVIPEDGKRGEEAGQALVASKTWNVLHRDRLRAKLIYGAEELEHQIVARVAYARAAQCTKAREALARRAACQEVKLALPKLQLPPHNCAGHVADVVVPKMNVGMVQTVGARRQVVDLQRAHDHEARPLQADGHSAAPGEEIDRRGGWWRRAPWKKRASMTREDRGIRADLMVNL